MKLNHEQPSIETIGRNIRRWREHREIKCEDFAAQIGLCKASLSKIENGQTDVTLQRVSEIAKALNLTAHQLLYSDPQSIISQWLQSGGVNSKRKFLITSFEMLLN